MSEALIAFITARYDEDERDIDTREHDSGQCDYLRGVHYEPDRALSEIAAKRRILAEVVPLIDRMDAAIEGEWGMGNGPTGESDLLLKLLALPYGGHAAWKDVQCCTSSPGYECGCPLDCSCGCPDCACA